MLNFLDLKGQFKPESGHICILDELVLNSMNSVATTGYREHKINMIICTVENYFSNK